MIDQLRLGVKSHILKALRDAVSGVRQSDVSKNGDE